MEITQFEHNLQTTSPDYIKPKFNISYLERLLTG